MLKALLKIGAFYVIWTWLKPRWKALLYLGVFLFLVQIIFSGIHEFQQLPDEQRLMFVGKWSLIILGLVVYFCYNLFRRPATEKQVPDQDAHEPPPNAQGDGFDFLRNKKKLKSRVDKIIENKNG